MEPLVHFKVQSENLSLDEFTQVFITILRENHQSEFSTMIFNHFLKKHQNNDKSGLNITRFSQEITNIIANRPRISDQDQKDKNEPNKSLHAPKDIHIIDLPISHIGSFLNFESYMDFKMCAREIYANTKESHLILHNGILTHSPPTSIRVKSNAQLLRPPEFLKCLVSMMRQCSKVGVEKKQLLLWSEDDKLQNATIVAISRHTQEPDVAEELVWNPFRAIERATSIDPLCKRMCEYESNYYPVPTDLESGILPIYAKPTKYPVCIENALRAMSTVDLESMEYDDLKALFKRNDLTEGKCFVSDCDAQINNHYSSHWKQSHHPNDTTQNT
eukprot:327498_1